MEIILLIVGIVAAVPVIYFIWDRHRTDVHAFELDEDNTFFTRYICAEYKLSGNFAIALYNCKVINKSSRTRAIKEILLAYKIRNNKICTDSHILLTGSIYSSHEKDYVNSIILNLGADKIVIMNWENMRQQISKSGNLGEGESLGGSLFFVLETADFEDIKQLATVKVIIRDYMGAETKHKIQVKENWRTNAENKKILHQKFIQHDGGDLEFA